MFTQIYESMQHNNDKVIQQTTETWLNRVLVFFERSGLCPTC